MPTTLDTVARRSGCPVSTALEVLGDRWALLIVRDLMVRGARTFKDFEQAGEHIATNVLANRLVRLRASGIVTAERDLRDRRRVNYRLTGKGIALAPLMLELLIWGARNERTSAPPALIDDLERHRLDALAEVRRRWEAREATPFLPPFADRPRRRAAVHRGRTSRPPRRAAVKTKEHA